MIRAYLDPYKLFLIYEDLRKLFNENPNLRQFRNFRMAPETTSILKKHGILSDYFFYIWDDLKKFSKDEIVLSLHQRIDSSANVVTINNMQLSNLQASIEKIEKQSSLKFSDFSKEKDSNNYKMIFKKQPTDSEKYSITTKKRIYHSK